ncbi:hypothetical protein ACHAWF_008730 [Thalassiosira exigua]
MGVKNDVRKEPIVKAKQWKAIRDKRTGRIYYYHRETRVARWDKPPATWSDGESSPLAGLNHNVGVVEDTASTETLANAKRWKATRDERTGKTYYYHRATRVSRWDKPPGFDEAQREKKAEKKFWKVTCGGGPKRPPEAWDNEDIVREVQHPTLLFEYLQERDWIEALKRARDQPREVRIWISSGICSPAQSTWKVLPLHVAIILGGPSKLVQELISIYPNAVTRKDFKGSLPIHIAASAYGSYLSSEEIFSTLFEAYPESKNVKDGRGNTPLRLLFDNVNYRDKKANRRRLRILELLLGVSNDGEIMSKETDEEKTKAEIRIDVDDIELIRNATTNSTEHCVPNAQTKSAEIVSNAKAVRHMIQDDAESETCERESSSETRQPAMEKASSHSEVLQHIIQHGAGEKRGTLGETGRNSKEQKVIQHTVQREAESETCDGGESTNTGKGPMEKTLAHPEVIQHMISTGSQIKTGDRARSSETRNDLKKQKSSDLIRRKIQHSAIGTTDDPKAPSESRKGSEKEKIPGRDAKESTESTLNSLGPTSEYLSRNMTNLAEESKGLQSEIESTSEKKNESTKLQLSNEGSKESTSSEDRVETLSTPSTISSEGTPAIPSSIEIKKDQLNVVVSQMEGSSSCVSSGSGPISSSDTLSSLVKLKREVEKLISVKEIAGEHEQDLMQCQYNSSEEPEIPDDRVVEAIPSDLRAKYGSAQNVRKVAKGKDVQAKNSQKYHVPHGATSMQSVGSNARSNYKSYFKSNVHKLKPLFSFSKSSSTSCESSGIRQCLSDEYDFNTRDISDECVAGSKSFPSTEDAPRIDWIFMDNSEEESKVKQSRHGSMTTNLADKGRREHGDVADPSSKNIPAVLSNTAALYDGNKIGNDCRSDRQALRDLNGPKGNDATNIRAAKPIKLGSRGISDRKQIAENENSPGLFIREDSCESVHLFSDAPLPTSQSWQLTNLNDDTAEATTVESTSIVNAPGSSAGNYDTTQVSPPKLSPCPSGSQSFGESRESVSQNWQRLSITDHLSHANALEDTDSPTNLFLNLHQRDWVAALGRVSEHPIEASIWIRRKKNGYILWKLLPLHAAIMLGAPSYLVLEILHAFPNAARARDMSGALPVHLAAARIDSHPEGGRITRHLIRAFPDSIGLKDSSGCTARDILKLHGREVDFVPTVEEDFMLGHIPKQRHALTKSENGTEAEQKCSSKRGSVTIKEATCANEGAYSLESGYTTYASNGVDPIEQFKILELKERNNGHVSSPTVPDTELLKSGFVRITYSEEDHPKNESSGDDDFI